MARSSFVQLVCISVPSSGCVFEQLALLVSQSQRVWCLLKQLAFGAGNLKQISRLMQATDTVTSTWDTRMYIKDTPPFVTAKFKLKYIFESIVQGFY